MQTKGGSVIIGHHHLGLAIIYEGLGSKVINDHVI
jgi:hypothetical protein